LRAGAKGGTIGAQGNPMHRDFRSALIHIEDGLGHLVVVASAVQGA